jgi:RNA polymerase sigma factor (sigma-70 family)
MDKEFPISFDALRNKVFRFAGRLLHDDENARDITQDVFEKIWNMQKQARLSGNIEALAMTMTKNLCLDKLKHEKQKQYKLQVLRDSQEAFFQPADYDRKNTFQVIRELIDKLPEKQKMVIHLRDVESFSFDEIAEIMQMDVSAVRMNVSRARKTVKENLIKTMNYGLQQSR